VSATPNQEKERRGGESTFVPRCEGRKGSRRWVGNNAGCPRKTVPRRRGGGAHPRALERKNPQKKSWKGKKRKIREVSAVNLAITTKK